MHPLLFFVFSHSIPVLCRLQLRRRAAAVVARALSVRRSYRHTVVHPAPPPRRPQLPQQRPLPRLGPLSQPLGVQPRRRRQVVGVLRVQDELSQRLYDIVNMLSKCVD